MCTAVTYRTKDAYFGRNLDLEYSYCETVTITPRNYEFHFRKQGNMKTHYAMIGMAFVAEEYPLYYDATNEKGLSMAGLNFPGNAVYYPEKKGANNVATFEFIPWVLGQCATVEEAKTILQTIHLTNHSFREDLPPSSLHWIIADRETAITVEAVADGMKVYDNPIGVLTNNPPFPYHMMRLNDYMALSADIPQKRFAEQINLTCYSRGMGAIGLPGDWSSSSRFVRAAFVKCNSRSDESEGQSVNQFFHILDSVAMPRGCVLVEGEKEDITIYSSCCNVDKGIYYYTTYDNRKINCVDMHQENLDGQMLISYELKKENFK